MRIQHNIMAMNAYRNYNKNTSALSKNLEKLSSGYKINRAGDDAAGLAISEKMRAQITGLEAAQKNVKDGISLVNTAEGAMQEIQDMMNRMVYLATESANGTFDNEVDRKNLQAEVDQLRSEINRIADSANFNGIKLLDGSLDAESSATISAGSAIQNVTVNDYKATGPSAAFEATYITNRPEAAISQTNAAFSISFDDVTVTKPIAATDKATIEVTIGGTTVTAEATTAGQAMTGADIAAALVANGKLPAVATSVAEFAGGTVGDADADGLDLTATWKNELTGDAADTDTESYIEINGHFYKMEVDGTNDNKVNFTQVDYMGPSGGEIITPDFEISTKAKIGDQTGTVNWHVQDPVTGLGIGASHQAQVEVAIDFSKLKDGDTLNVGDMTYDFRLVASTETANTGANGKMTIDLTDIFKTEADYADEDKQAQAMVRIANKMNSVLTTATSAGTPASGKNNTWSVGNQGVADGKGTLTFQSLSTYNGDTVTANKAHIAASTDNAVCDMRTEADVMKQFYSNSKESAASVSFNVDVTKIKEGDTITIDGVTFEFTDGTNVSDKGNVAIDLSSYGLANGGTIPSYNTKDVMNALKTAITKNIGTTKYTTSFDGDKMTLTSKALTGSTFKHERVAADVKLGSSSYDGNALVLQIGETSDDFNQLAVSVKDMHVASLGIDAVDITTAEGAKAAIDVIKNAINTVSAVRGTLGALSNRLDHTSNNLSVMRENIQDAESSIRDTDVAEEMMAYTKNNILVQSAQAMLAQANQVPQGVLQLLQ